jgi:hypothetical protein
VGEDSTREGHGTCDPDLKFPAVKERMAHGNPFEGYTEATEGRLCLHGKESEGDSLTDQPLVIAILCEVS